MWFTGSVGREHNLAKTRMHCVGAVLSCPTAACHSAPSVELAHLGLLCKVQDASVEQVVEEPRNCEDPTNDCAQLHKEVQQLLSSLRVTHGSETAFRRALSLQSEVGIPTSEHTSKRKRMRERASTHTY